MLLTVAPLAVNPIPVPACVFGLIALVLFLIGLAAVIGLGASRPHS
jgi:hypothetical protein